MFDHDIYLRIVIGWENRVAQLAMLLDQAPLLHRHVVGHLELNLSFQWHDPIVMLLQKVLRLNVGILGYSLRQLLPQLPLRIFRLLSDL